MDSFDALTVVLAIIAVLSSLFFIMAILADIVWPWIAQRRPSRQATYKRKQA